MRRSTSAAVVLVLLSGFFCAFGEPSNREVSALRDSVLNYVDQRVSLLARRMDQSQSLRTQVAGSMPLDVDHLLLHDVIAGEYDPCHLDAIRQSVQQAVDLSQRYPGPISPLREPEVRLLRKSGIFLVEVSYPPVIVSETEEREVLTVRFWVSPDRPTALALFWLRRGGSLPDPDSGLVPKVSSAWHSLLKIEDPPGESAYSFGESTKYNAPPKKGDPRAGGDRMGFIRDNLVVEISTWTFVRNRANTESLTLGMMAGGSKEAVAMMRVLDSFILGLDQA